MAATILLKACVFVAFALQLRNCLAIFTTTTTPAQPVTLDWSNLNMTREDFFLRKQHRTSMKEVTELILRGNKLDSFLDCASVFKNVQILDLSHNNLERFFFLCITEEKLLSLNVSYNQIEYIGDKALSHKVIQLKVLDVSHNDIYVVNDTMLQHMKNLEWLSLASNPIEENLDQEVFQNLTKLKHLNLRNISSPYFTSHLFESLVNLEYLDLSDNPIEGVPPLPANIKELYICGTNIVHLNSFVMPHLRVFVIDNSPNLSTVLLNNFDNLNELEILSMRDSPQLSQIRIVSDLEGIMSSHLLPSLKRLHLQNCGLENLPEEMASIIERTAVVHLKNNPWRCDCKLKWLAVLNLTTDLVSSLRCQTPERHRNNLLHNISSWDLVCEHSVEAHLYSAGNVGRILYPILWVSCALLILGTASVGVVYLYWQGCLGQWVSKMRHRGTDTVSYKNVIDHSNDTVRILPVESNEPNEA